MKRLIYILLLVVLSPSGFAQTFVNGELNGSVNFVSTPTSWQEIPFTDPICQANTVAEATVDILDATGPNQVGGVAGNPFSGTTFCSGLHSTDGGAFFWHEGIMQDVGGLVVGNSYSIDFRQTVVKQQNAIDESGSWRIYIDGTLLATSAVSTSTLAFDDVNLQWDCRNVTFTATATTHTIKFIPWDDDPNQLNDPLDNTGALRMGIDLIEFTPTVDVTPDPIGPVCDPSVAYPTTGVDPGGIWSGTGIQDSIFGSFHIPGGAIPPASYWIYYTLPVGCSTVTDSILIDYVTLTFDVAVTDESCNSGNGELVITPLTGSGPYSFSIDNGANTQPTGTFSSLSANTYDIIVVDNATGCFGTGTQVINNLPEPTLDSVLTTNLTCSTICDGTISVFGTGASVYSISPGSSNGTGLFNSLCADTYLVTIDDGNGCTADTNVTLTGASGATASFSFTPTNLTPIENTISLFNNSTNADSYIWEISGPNGYYDVYDQDISFYEFPETVGTYQICLIAEINNNCPDTMCVTIVMRDDFSMFIPNTFTPNSDEFNSVLVTYINGIDNFNFEMTIYNRWGEVVFKTQDKDHYWDGTYLGKPVPDGTYNWKIEVKNPNNDDKDEYVGHVNVIR